jgi:hypothetical protein
MGKAKMENNYFGERSIHQKGNGFCCSAVVWGGIIKLEWLVLVHLGLQ